MRVASLLLSFLLLVAAPASAQFDAPAEPCPPGEAVGTLRGGSVQARLFTNGNLFYDQTRDQEDSYYGEGYLVPTNVTASQGLPPSPIDTATLWVGGVVDDSVRASAPGYGAYAFRPGLTGPDGTAPTPDECAQADRIWVVSREDIERYNGGGLPTDDLAQWPVHLGAPVLDGDGIEGNYDLAAGDQPAIRGDEMAFWAMTDTAAERTGRSYFSPNLPTGVDVTVEAFAFRNPPLHTETFYRFTITNRNGATLDSAYVSMAGLWAQRRYASYFLGTDAEGQMLYVYSPDGSRAEDSDYAIPPASGFVLLRGPEGTDGERLGLTATRYLHKSRAPHAFPYFAREVHNTQLGLMNSGRAVHAHGEGFLPHRGPFFSETTYFWHGDPVTADGWSEVNFDNDDERDPQRSASDLRMGALSSGPFRLAPGEFTTATFALAFAQGRDALASVRGLQARARGLLSAQASGTFEASRVGSATPSPLPLAVGQPRPNPFREATTLVLQGAVDTPVRVSVYDVLGRRLSTTQTTTSQTRMEIGRELGAGVYVVRVEGRAFAETFKVVKTR